MINIVYNRHMVAMGGREVTDAGTVPCDMYEMFGTPYGLFVPVTLSAHQFLRWVRRGMKGQLPKNAISSYCIHVSNDGEVLVMYLDTGDDTITLVPYQSEKFALLSGRKEITEAFNALLVDCQSIGEAIQIVEESDYEGVPGAQILLVKDWVDYAAQKGYTEIFYRTHFSDAVYELA